MDDNFSTKLLYVRHTFACYLPCILFEHGWALEVGRRYLSTASHGTDMPDSYIGFNYKSRE